MEISPIAIIHNAFKEKFGIPRQSGRSSQLISEIKLLKPYNVAEAVRGIEIFSHLWLIFDFSENHRDHFSPTVRPPRLGGNTRIGVFASRSPFRPNNLGLSSVKLNKVVCENGEVTLFVEGADLLDGTPIFDIKPYIPFSDCHTDAVAGFFDEQKNHRLNVIVSDELKQIIPENYFQTIVDCLADDPRPSYQNSEDRIYSMRFANLDVHFVVVENDLIVKSIDQLQKTN